MRERLKVIIPQSSVFGTMFERVDKRTVVKSTNTGILQHDPYSWMLDGPRFVKLKGLSRSGQKNEEQFRKRMEKMTLDEKREVVETLFNLIDSSGAKTLSELMHGGLPKIIAIIKSYGGLDKEKRDMMIAILLRVFELKKA